MRIFALLMMIFISCAMPVYPQHMGPVYTWTVGTEFSEAECDAIRKASQTWSAYSHGWVTVRLVFNDARDTRNIRKVDMTHPVIVRTIATTGNPGVLAVVSDGDTRMYMIAERLTHPDDFFEVTLHEMGHMFGMNHVSDPGAIMYPYHRVPGATCPRWSDMREFCLATGCMLTEVEWCSDGTRSER